MPDVRSPIPPASRFGRRPMPHKPREPEPRAGDEPADATARPGGPWPLWSTALPDGVDAKVATGPVHGTEPAADPMVTTTLFRTWLNGPCKTIYCCALEGVSADGALTLGAAGRATASAVESLAHAVMATSGASGSQKPGFVVHPLGADPAAVRQEILDAVIAAPWSSGICFLYDPQAIERGAVLAGLGLMPDAPVAAPAADAAAAPEAGD